MITNFKLFEGKYVNKFDFEEGQSYEFEDLPKQVQEDIAVQFEDDYDNDPGDYNYIFRLVPLEEYGADVEETLGYDIEEYINDPYMKRLLRNIKKNGLNYPAVGSEGNHRKLAYYIMGKPLPYLYMELKSDEELDKKYNVDDNDV